MSGAVYVRVTVYGGSLLGRWSLKSAVDRKQLRLPPIWPGPSVMGHWPRRRRI